MIIEELTYLECQAMLQRAESLVLRALWTTNRTSFLSMSTSVTVVSMVIRRWDKKSTGCGQTHLCVSRLRNSLVTNFGLHSSSSASTKELPDTPENAYARSLAERLFQRRPMWWEPATVPIVDHPPRNPILFRILVKRMSGRQAKPERQEAPYIPTSGSRQRSRLLHALRRLFTSASP